MVTKAEAKLKGLKYYHTGKACKRGHIADRSVSSGTCLACKRLREQTPEYLAAKAAHREVYKEKAAAKYQEWYSANREKKLQYQKDNAARYNFYWVRRKAHIKQATPKWANQEAIKLIYLNRPEGHHVDHEIPLRGKNVCGLHVENNLRYLTAEENMKKNNSYTIE